MPSNNSNAHALDEEFPGRLGLLMGPRGWRSPRKLRYALDNDRFGCWSRGHKWDQQLWLRMLEKASQQHSPAWVAVPDVVGDACATFRDWERWAPVVESFGYKAALVAQDGMTAESIRRNASPDVLFIGGTTAWKWRNVWGLCRAFARVHVGRVNTEKWLWNCDRCGAESVDGTGFFRGDQVQLNGLRRYLSRSSNGEGPVYGEFEFAKTYGGLSEASALYTHDEDD